MSIKNRLSKLEQRVPEHPIVWDGNPKTAEAFVLAKAAEKGICYNRVSFEGDPEQYIQSKLNEL